MLLAHFWRRSRKAHLLPERVSHPSRGERGRAGNLHWSTQIYILGSTFVYSDILEGIPRLTLPLEHT